MPDASAELSTGHLVEDLARRSVRGGVITFGAQGVKLVLQMTTVVILARLLAPAAFGLIAMVAALSAVLDLVKELGLSTATIRKPDITQDEVSALFWINAGAGALITVLLYLAAPLLADFYQQHYLVGITRWLGLGFFLSGLTVQHWALLRRQMRFTAVAAVDTGSEIGGFIVAIMLARSGAGYWALVAQRLAAFLLAMIGSWTLCAWRPSLPRRTAGVAELLRFGISVTAVNFAGTVGRNIDQVLVGWMWGAISLGLYERAAKLLLTPLNNLYASLYAVAVPALSRMDQGEARYRRVFCDIMEKLAMILIPAALIVAICTDWVVRVLLGAQFLAAAPLVACFAIAAACQPLTQAVVLLYLTQNRPREMLRASAIDVVLCLAAVAAGVRFGPNYVAAALALVSLVLRAPIAFWLASRRGIVSFWDIVTSILPSLIAGAAGAAVAGALRFAVLPEGLPATSGLAVIVCLAAPVVLLTFYAIPRSRSSLHRLGGMMRHLRGPAVELGKYSGSDRRAILIAGRRALFHAQASRLVDPQPVIAELREDAALPIRTEADAAGGAAQLDRLDSARGLQRAATTDHRGK